MGGLQYQQCNGKLLRNEPLVELNLIQNNCDPVYHRSSFNIDTSNLQIVTSDNCEM